MPDLAEVLIERHGIPEAQLKSMHVLLTEETPNSPDLGMSRLITTAMLVDRPIKVGVYGIGTAIKTPPDEADRSIGRAIAIARACQYAGWRFFWSKPGDSARR